MKDKSEIEVEHYKQLLDQTSRHLSPAIHAQLDENRRHAMAHLETNRNYKISNWRPVFAFTIAIFVIAVFLIYPQTTEQPATDIYADLELLMDEEQLDFLADMDVSGWIVSANDG